MEDWVLRASTSRDSRIHGGVNTQGTVTGRMTASQPNLQQVSGDSRARALFVPKDSFVQVGIDASGLEARLLASRMARWDKGEFARQVLDEDIHVVNQKAAGLPDRDSAKTFFYAEQEYAKKYMKSVKLEHKVARIISDQIVNGFGFDLDAATNLEADLLMEKVSIEDDLGQIFPPIIEERYSEKTGKRLKDKITIFNPGSRKQISERLKSKYNWKPSLTEKGNPKVDEAVLKKLPFAEAKELVRYFAITKLLSQVEDWVLRASTSRDSRIHGGVNTQGTVTGRMTASQPNLQQVSGDSRARALFVPKDSFVQVGIDASGLEARLLASRMARWDKGEFARQVLDEDIHVVNQKAAGLPDRDSAKTFFYALIYGAGDLKIGQIVKAGPKRGKEIKKQYLDSMPALKQLLSNVEWQVQRKGTITLLDGREVPCRAAHKALNVQLQGDGAMLMKVAQMLFDRSLKPFRDEVRFMATVHDEWQLECNPIISDIVGTLGCQAIKRAGEILSCQIEMDGEFRVGKNWSECH